jgi:hypothetical protein
MIWVTQTDLENTLTEAGFIHPRVAGGFAWVWHENRDQRAWMYSVRFGSRWHSRKTIRARLTRALTRVGAVEITWVYTDEAEFFFHGDIIDAFAAPEPEDDDDYE